VRVGGVAHDTEPICGGAGVPMCLGAGHGRGYEHSAGCRGCMATWLGRACRGQLRTRGKFFLNRMVNSRPPTIARHSWGIIGRCSEYHIP